MSDVQTIPARQGRAAFVQRGQAVKIINSHGEQVVDTWAFVRHDLQEFMSMEHTRATLVKIMPAVGDCLYTTRRRPILKIVEDTSPGIHDTLMAACDSYRYGLLGCTEYHDNCTDNLRAAMYALGLIPPETPSPFNLFMNIPWQRGGELSFDPPVTRPGDYIMLEALLDVVMVFSACPQDILPINGTAGQPTEAHFQISGPRPEEDSAQPPEEEGSARSARDNRQARHDGGEDQDTRQKDEEKTTRPRKTKKEALAIPAAIAKLDTKAAKIRALARKGWSDSDIAQALRIHYQQAYNTSHRPIADYDPAQYGRHSRGRK